MAHRGNTTQRKVKDSIILFHKLIFRGNTTLHQGYETVVRNNV